MSDTFTNPQDLGKAFQNFQAYHAKSLDQKIGTTEATLKSEIAKSSADVLKHYDELKAQYDEAQKAQKSLQDSIDELATKFNRTGNAYSDGVSNEIVKQADRFNLIKLARFGYLNGEAEGSKKVNGEEYAAYTKAFNSAMRRDIKLLSADTVKALSVGSDPDGGAWIAPPTVADRITKRVFETTPMRDLATVQTIGTESLEILQDPNDISAGWVSETGIRNDTNSPPVAVKKITAYELYAQPKATQKLLEDENIDMEGWLADKVADRFSRVENTAFVIGTGAEQPRGFLTYPAGTGNALSATANYWGQIEQVGSGQSGQFTYGGLIRIMTSLKDPFHANAKWLVNRYSVAQIMLLTDANGRLIFQPLQGGLFNSTPLLNYELRYAADMPTTAAGSMSAAFGDFKAGYVIVDRVGISVIRDNLTNKPFIKFYTRKRTGGDVDNYDAIKIQVLQ